MLLSNGRHIILHPDCVIYDNYTYGIEQFSKSRTLTLILKDIELENATQLLNHAYRYYLPISKVKAGKQHAGSRNVTRNRDKKGAEYGVYKSLIIQVRKLQMQVNFDKKGEFTNV